MLYNDIISGYNISLQNCGGKQTERERVCGQNSELVQGLPGESIPQVRSCFHLSL